MATDTLPKPSLPITTPLRPKLGFLAATPIIAGATILLLLIVALSVLGLRRVRLGGAAPVAR